MLQLFQAVVAVTGCCSPQRCANATRVRTSWRTPTGARTNFSRCSLTSSGIPSPRSATRCTSCACRPTASTFSRWRNGQVALLARLVDDLLDVSRITQGKIVLRKERVLLADVIAQALDAVRPQSTHDRRR
jgi:signal transduction histidine kinase